MARLIVFFGFFSLVTITVIAFVVAYTAKEGSQTEPIAVLVFKIGICILGGVLAVSAILILVCAVIAFFFYYYSPYFLG